MVTRLTMLTVLTYVAQVRKGGVLMVRGRPCKVTAVSEFQNGKHGASKCHFVGQCLFTGDKKEELMSSGHSAEILFVKKKELQAMYISDQGFVACLCPESYETRGDLKLPELLHPNWAAAKELSAKICRLVEEDREFNVVVLSACGQEQIVDVKLM